ncbi:MAG: hypothetical protein LBI05_08550 [Planctomycetaceae bacterium]|nr:hypothetical protein [Planctomycetaceae bacterium]
MVNRLFPKSPMQHTLLSVALILLTTTLVLAQKNLPEGWKETQRIDLPTVELRFFGAVAGTYYQYDIPKGTASLLSIQTESEKKAQFLHDKFLHDVVQANKSLSLRDEIPIYALPDKSYLSIRLDGERLFLVTAQDVMDLLSLLNLTGPVSPPAPPYRQPPLPVRAWNDYPFRFYYWFDQHPRGVEPRNYRSLPEFDWAKEQNTGFIDWVNVATNDSAEGLSVLNGIHWAIRAAERRGLPVVINTSLTNNQAANTNRFASEVQRGMPDYVGSFYCVADQSHAGVRELSWASHAGKDAILATLQNVVRQTKDYPNVIEYLEPHGELRHGNHDIYLEYGPVADAGFQDFLKHEYNNDLSVLSRRWFDDPNALKSWDEVRVPEIASFAGWNPDAPFGAIDLKGDWRIQYEPPRGTPPQFENGQAREKWERAIRAPAEWFADNFDDSAWATIPAPGHDRIMFTHQRNPAVFRRTFHVPSDWHKTNQKTWIYVWDLNRAHGHTEQVWINGKLVGEQVIPHPRNNVMVFEVSDVLQSGDNSIAIRVAEGFLAYKVYLSPVAPRWYPELTPTENRRWVDFAAWWRTSRLEAVRRGLEMIREVEPDREIVCMSPYSYFAGMRELCAKYGGHFHDTGGMSGTYSLDLPGMMRGAGLPCSLEPGGPAGSAEELRRFTSLWAVEGINAVHYFIHIGAVLWNPEIKELFEKLKPQIQFMGKHHIPRGEVASLMDDRIGNLTDFPLIGPEQHNVFIRHDPGLWSPARYFTQEYYWDTVTLYDFEATEQDNLKQYRTVIDTNCSILSEKQVSDIERWVRDGGLFVTFVQTGRHTPDKADAWSIEKLTGYRVTGIDPHDGNGEARWRKLRIAENQTIFSEEHWAENQRSGNGLSLEKVAPECENLLYWEDGSVAAGIRPLGKGYVIHLGAKFSNTTIWWGNGATKTVFEQILDWRKTSKHPARAEHQNITMQPSVTNDFLYDVWTLACVDRDACSSRIIFAKDQAPEELTEVGTGKVFPVTLQQDGKYATGPIPFERHETRIFTAPRKETASAPLQWLELQRAWWRGAWKPDPQSPPLAPLPQDYTVDLNAGWFVKSLAENEKPESFITNDFDDSLWTRGRMESWTVPEDSPSNRRMFRKTLVIPEQWKGGTVELMFQGHYDSPFMGRGTGRLWIDGREVERFFRGVPLTDWKPGKTYQIAVYCEGWTDVSGPAGNIWLAWLPEPEQTIDLSGDWTMTKDFLHWNEQPQQLPGVWSKEMRGAKRTFTMPKMEPDTQVYVRYEAVRSGLTGVIINGRYLRRHHHDLSERTWLNITPWLRFGAENEIEIVGRENENQEIKLIRLDCYRK